MDKSGYKLRHMKGETMSKSVLVIDTPNTCAECPLHYKAELISLGNFNYEQTFRCNGEPEGIEDPYLSNILKIKPTWCPLTPLPEHKNLALYVNGDMNIFQYNYAQGFNDCLEQIQKGK